MELYEQDFNIILMKLFPNYTILGIKPKKLTMYYNKTENESIITGNYPAASESIHEFFEFFRNDKTFTEIKDLIFNIPKNKIKIFDRNKYNKKVIAVFNRNVNGKIEFILYFNGLYGEDSCIISSDSINMMVDLSKIK